MKNAAITDLATRLENERIKAIINSDIDTLKELLSDDLYYGHTAGYVDNKTAFLEKLASGTYSYFSIKAQINSAEAIGESGLTVNGELTIEANSSGEKKVFHAIYLGVWRQEAGNWRFLSLQAAFKK